MTDSLSPSCCTEIRPTIGDFVEGDLDEVGVARTKAHLAKCPACAIFVQKLRNASAACRAHLLKQVPDGLEDRLMSFLRKKCGESAKDPCADLALDDTDGPAGDF